VCGESRKTKFLYCILQFSWFTFATEPFHTQNIFLEPLMKF
jgi:hypothetical protein